MGLSKVWIVLGLGFVSSFCHADFLLSGESGRSHVSLKSSESIEVLDDADKNAINGSVSFEIRPVSFFRFGVALTANNSGSIGASDDRIRFYESSVTADFAVPLSKQLHFLVGGGFSYWDFSAAEGQLFSPGEEEGFDDTGYDSFYRAGFEWHFEEVPLFISFTARQGDYEFGEYESYMLGFGWRFLEN